MFCSVPLYSGHQFETPDKKQTDKQNKTTVILTQEDYSTTCPHEKCGSSYNKAHLSFVNASCSPGPHPIPQ